MSYDDEILEFKRMLFLGARIAKKKPLFQKLASMGYEKARWYAEIEFYKWITNNPDADVEDTLQKFCELIGMAELMPTLKELTRISMILGDTKEIEKWKKEQKDDGSG